MRGSKRRGKKPEQHEGRADIVVLRRWRKDGGIVALFPEIPATDDLVASYQHVGQHGAADYDHVVSRTLPVSMSAPDQETENLLDELRKIGYSPVARQRRP